MPMSVLCVCNAARGSNCFSAFLPNQQTSATEQCTTVIDLIDYFESRDLRGPCSCSNIKMMSKVLL